MVAYPALHYTVFTWQNSFYKTYYLLNINKIKKCIDPGIVCNYS